MSILGKILLNILTLFTPTLISFIKKTHPDNPFKLLKNSNAQVNCPLIGLNNEGKYICLGYKHIYKDSLKKQYHESNPTAKPIEQITFPFPCSVNNSKKCDIYLYDKHSQEY